jgi:hypothetical protein
MSPMKKLTFPLALIALVGVLAGPAHAGKTSGVSGSITLDTGGSTMLAASSTLPELKYGGEAHFKATVQGRQASGSTVYVTVVCTQGSTVVYQWSADPSFSFPLTDQAGQGLEWNGNAADCSGSLVYRQQNGKNVTITYLDTTAFKVD